MSLNLIKNNHPEISLAVQRLRLCLPIQGVQIQSLVGKLRPHMPGSQKKKSKSNAVTKFNKLLKNVLIKEIIKNNNKNNNPASCELPLR